VTRRTRFVLMRQRDRGAPVPLPIVVVIVLAILFLLAAAAVVFFVGMATEAGAATPGGDRAEASPADLRRGQLLFLQCRACHGLQDDREGKIGPPLGGFYDRPAARLEDYGYSPALAGAGLTWDEATLDRWLERPSAMVAASTMVFPGMPEAEDRRRLILYLRQATAPREE
jgi:cytochrome c